MTRAFWVGALLLGGCGGTDQGAVFDAVGGGRPGGAESTSGAAGDTIAVAGSGGSSVQQAGQAGGGTQAAGGAPGSAGAATTAGQSPVGGASQNGGAAGYAPTGGAGSGGSGGSESTAGAKPDAGSGGVPEPLECPKGGLDCDGLASNGCETSTLSHDHCGACDIKCGVSQKCVPGKATGAPVCLTQ